MIKRIKFFFKNKSGMTLVEVMTAMTILTLMIFCFAPLMLSYLETINISGQSMKSVYNESGKLQVLLGKAVSQEKYTVNVSDVEMVLQAPETTVEVNGENKTISANVKVNVDVTGLTSGGKFSDETGNINVESGYSTFYAGALNTAAGIKTFPNTLTDDFKVAYITIFGYGGVNFQAGGYSVCATNPDGSDLDLTYGEDYEIEKHPDASGWDTLLLTIYGGTKISFETSPLVFKYDGKRYEIQIDAPMMIMVGEKAPDEEYYYYVSRGETEAINGEDHLLIHSRKMNSTDEVYNDKNKKTGATGATITLNSAMNDVEWVPASSADDNAVDSSGNSYGYYVMCGDNGQVRRFWKRPSREIENNEGKTITVDGNYYWGGDYTYYTDIELDRTKTIGTMNYGLDGADHKEGRTYSTNVSYRFLSKREDIVGNSGSGYNLAVRGDNKKMQSLNTSSITAYIGTNNSLEFFGSDGKLFTFNQKSSGTPTIYFQDIYASGTGIDNFRTVGDYVQDSGEKDYRFEAPSGNNVTNIHRMKYFNFESYAWLKGSAGSYYTTYGINASNLTNLGIAEYSIPITLTSVDAIVLSGSGDGYYTGATSEKNYEYSDGNATYNTYLEKYPKSTYTLYAGHIPAYMDIWSTTTENDYNSVVGIGTTGHGWEPIIETDFTDTVKTDSVSSNLNRKNNTFTESGAKSTAYWKATLGITPYIKPSSSSNTVAERYAGNLLIENTKQNVYEAYKKHGDCDYQSTQAVYWPYTNIDYAFTGKFYDSSTQKGNLFPDTSVISWRNHTLRNGKQGYMTNGRVVDITVAYLSHPFATHAAMNPTDDVVFDNANDKNGNKMFYWNNRRETLTLLDIASTVIPSGENDVPVSLAVGYVTGGIGEFEGDDELYPNTIMNNGIVLLRAGTAEFGTQSSSNSTTGEYYAKDSTGYALSAESNYFHQFYYLNSKYYYKYEDNGNRKNAENNEMPMATFGSVTLGNHIGDIWGADYWRNNDHIDYISLDGGAPDSASNKDSGNYNYLRCHPLSNTKVNCVAWGMTWDGNPEAMWGTDNGTVLSWNVNVTKAEVKGARYDGWHEGAENWNDRSVLAEFQSYQWIENVNGKKFAVNSFSWKSTVGAHINGEKEYKGDTFARPTKANSKNPATYSFVGYFDAKSREWDKVESIGFVSTLNSINDVCYADDIWIAVGDQSHKNPEEYCATTGLSTKDGRTLKAYSDSGSGSWVNVRYWTDYNGTGKHSTDNDDYAWKAVKISDEQYCNIVQINHVNGIWVATGYLDEDKDGEFDDKEPARIFWAYNPLVSCDAKTDDNGGWSSHIRLYESGNLMAGYDDAEAFRKMGGINSCATRD